LSISDTQKEHRASLNPTTSRR